MASQAGPYPPPRAPKILKGIIFVLYTKLHVNDVIKNGNTPPAK